MLIFVKTARARMLAIGCGYPDGNDFDRLRFVTLRVRRHRERRRKGRADRVSVLV